jgi:hypothetical protein
MNLNNICIYTFKTNMRLHPIIFKTYNRMKPNNFVTYSTETISFHPVILKTYYNG